MQVRHLLLAPILILLLVFAAACDQSGEEQESETGGPINIEETDETPEPDVGADEGTPGATSEEEATEETEQATAGTTPVATSNGDDPYTARESTAVPEVESSVEVTLVDYEIQMPSTVQAGIVVFEVKNDGDEQHGLAIEAPEGDAAVLGMREVEPGGTAQVEIPLEPGTYVAFCPVGDHREAHGMETEFTVE